jgi:hypothetical protein
VKIGGVRLKQPSTGRYVDITRLVQRATTKVKGPLASGTKGLVALKPLKGLK